MGNKIKKLKKLLSWIIILYRVVDSIISALGGDNPGDPPLPSVKKPDKGPKAA